MAHHTSSKIYSQNLSNHMYYTYKRVEILELKRSHFCYTVEMIFSINQLT